MDEELFYILPPVEVLLLEETGGAGIRDLLIEQDEHVLDKAARIQVMRNREKGPGFLPPLPASTGSIELGVLFALKL